ncbi:hypothetical protein ACFWIZ_44660, partial [Streptomyces sp. NPDC127044]
MEQRIGSKSQPLDAAAVNPAYIPGLTSPAKAEPKDAAVEAGRGPGCPARQCPSRAGGVGVGAPRQRGGARGGGP